MLIRHSQNFENEFIVKKFHSKCTEPEVMYWREKHRVIPGVIIK